MGSLLGSIGICGECTVNLDNEKTILRLDSDIKEVKYDIKTIKVNHLAHIEIDIAVIKNDLSHINGYIIEIKQLLHKYLKEIREKN